MTTLWVSRRYVSVGFVFFACVRTDNKIRLKYTHIFFSEIQYISYARNNYGLDVYAGFELACLLIYCLRFVTPRGGKCARLTRTLGRGTSRISGDALQWAGRTYISPRKCPFQLGDLDSPSIQDSLDPHESTS